MPVFFVNWGASFWMASADGLVIRPTVIVVCAVARCAFAPPDAVEATASNKMQSGTAVSTAQNLRDLERSMVTPLARVTLIAAGDDCQRRWSPFSAALFCARMLLLSA